MESPHTATKSNPHSPQPEKAHVQQQKLSAEKKINKKKMLVPISAIISIQRYIEINTCSISLTSFLFFFIILKHPDI